MSEFDLKYKKIKFISEGVLGKVYLVEKNDIKYAMKVLYIPDKNDISLKNELLFIKKVVSKHPEQFMQLIEYNIKENCNEPYPEIPKFITENDKQRILLRQRSKLCVEKIYSLVDTTLDKLPIKNFSKPELYSMFAQLFYIVYLIEKGGFIHGDLHRGNIGIINVEKNKKIKILNKEIPSFGRQYIVIDYDGVLHKNNISDKRKYMFSEITEAEKYKESLIIDKMKIMNLSLNKDNFNKYLYKNKIKIELDDNKILLQPEIELLKKFSKHYFILLALFRLFFPKKWLQLIFGNKYNQNIPFITTYINSNDLLYVYTNINKNKNLIYYFIAKLESYY